jgi:hypothetical protein
MVTREMLDYWEKAKRETINLAPKVPWVFTVEEFEARYPGRLAEAKRRLKRWYVPSEAVLPPPPDR